MSNEDERDDRLANCYEYIENNDIITFIVRDNFVQDNKIKPSYDIKHTQNGAERRKGSKIAVLKVIYGDLKEIGEYRIAIITNIVPIVNSDDIYEIDYQYSPIKKIYK